MSRRKPLRLFEATGIELEYMIVDADSLSVRPVADALLQAVGAEEGEIELGSIAWSNELALHIIELKTNGPAPTLLGLAPQFLEHIQKINQILAPMNARLMPTGMHPFMNPDAEFRLWPHENGPIYQAFDRIFNCKGHGWSNLQSTHINLPFANDEEFGRLHAAIRMVLPLLPALAACTPVVDGALSGLLDTRLEFYRKNAQKIPSVAGRIVPERFFDKASYEGILLEGIYKDLAPYDPEGILRHEWVNSRGCIARFDRDAIEIRLLDIQESPLADLAISSAVIEAVRALTEERFSSYEEQKTWDERALSSIFVETIKTADQTVITDAEYLGSLGYPESRGAAGEVWQHLIETTLARKPGYDEWAGALKVITKQGCLARRIQRALGKEPSLEALRAVYRQLCDHLAAGTLFTT